jgi:hypothetical protein
MQKALIVMASALAEAGSQMSGMGTRSTVYAARQDGLGAVWVGSES